MKLKSKVVLDEEFMSKYDGKNPFPNEMAGFTYARTYSQWLEEHSRREKWQETVKRVAEYSSSLYQGPSPIEDLQKEIHEMFDSVFSLNWLPAGRTLWSGGTKHSYENGGLSQFNCSFVAINTIESFYELMYALCLGVGVGFSVEKIHTGKLPNFNKNKIVTEDYKFDGYDSQNYLSGKFCEIKTNDENKTLSIKVPDSKEGWADGVRQILTQTSQLSGYTITVNLNSIRPEGDRIRGFGGKASGPAPYVSLLKLFDHILNKKESDNFKLEPIDVLDICNGIAKIIVAGGVRRCLPGEALVHMKNGLTQIKNVNVGELVMTNSGYKKVTNKFIQGEQGLVKVTTESGHFQCTPNHRVAVVKNVAGDIEWIEAGSLTPEMKLMAPAVHIDGVKTNLPAFNYEKPAHSTTCKDISIPELDTEIAWLLGLIFGDGYVYVDGKRGEISIACHSIDNPEIPERAKVVLERFGVNVVLEKTKDENCIKVRVKSKQLALFMSQFKRPNEPLVVPDFIVIADVDIRSAFLAGLMDSDGAATNRPVSALVSVYENFIYQVQKLYSSLGIQTKICKTLRKEIGWKDIYSLNILGIKAKDKYLDYVQKFSSKIVDKQTKPFKSYTISHSMFNGVVVNSEDRVGVCLRNGLDVDLDVYEYKNDSLKFYPVSVVSVENSGSGETFDIEVEDVSCFYADGYLVHNSAQLCLFDEGDQDIVSAKMNFWNNEFTSHRNMSNNSIHFWTMPTMENLLKLIDPIKNSYEPGLYNALTASKRRVLYYGSNPCCFSGNTRVLTSNGYYQIQDLLDKEVEVWNGMEWSKVTPYYAGHHDTVIVALSDGTSLRCTPNHKFVLKGDLRVEADDLKIGDKLEKFQFPIIDADQKNDPVIDAYSQGFYSGDGNTDMTKSWIYQPKYLCIPRLIGSFGDETIYNRKTWTHGPMLDKRFVPINASLKYKLNWLAGLFDADGFAVDSPNSTTLQLASIDHDFLMDLKLLLTTLGCSSKVVNAREAKQVMMPNNKGGGEYDLYNCKQIWRILINTNQVKTLLNLGIKFNRLNIAKSDPDRDATRFVTVVGVTESTPDDVYCFSDPLNGTGTFEGVVTSNSEILLSDKGVCNLVTVVISRHVNEKGEFDMDKLRKSFKGATRHCLRITNTDLELPEWDKVQKRDRLLGVSMTGCEDAFDMTDTGRFAKRGFDKRIIKTTEGEMSVDRFKKKMNEIANKEARDYAFEMRVPSPLLVCTIKPEGTLSILAGVSSGAHKNFGTTYRRRVRINRFDALAKVALEMGLRVYPESGQGYLKSWDSLDQDVKKMILDQANTWVVEFPIKTGAKSNAFDETANSQLSRYLSYQNCYADHSTSITISVADDEWVKLFKRIYKHWDLFIGISFQNKSNDKYDLAPYELMTQDEYEYEASQIKSVNMFELLERAEKEGMMAHEDLGSDCVGGACPIR